MRTWQVLLALAAAALLAGLPAGCSDSTDPAGDGRLVVNLIDAPAAYDSVIVAVERVEVHRDGEDSNSGWLVVHDTPASFDLLQLVDGASAVLADHALAPGRYTQLRLILGDGSYVVEAGERHDLRVPSGLQTGIKLNHPFDIEPQQIYEITLDFDAARSIHVTGNGQHVLRPTIRCVWNAIAGAVTGTVLPAAAKSTVWTVAGGDTVSAFADSLTGDFRLSMLPAGSYDLRVEPLETAWLDTMLAGVVVLAQQTTDVDTVQLRAQSLR